MNGLLLTLPVALPFTAGLLSYFIRFPSKHAQNLWYGGIICLTTALAWLAILLVGEERVTLLHFTDTLTIALRCDGAARLFAALSATLWPFTALYACDYMRHEKHLAMFWSFFTASFGVTLGIAFSANMLTMYLFYELLTLATLPLVKQPMTAAAKAAGEAGSLYTGVEMTLRGFEEALKKLGMERVEAAPGTVFDPEKHNAVMMTEADEEHPEGTIIECFQTGFAVRGKVVRYAMVRVAN